MGVAPRYVTLSDYLRVLRANRLLILVVAVAFAGAAYALASQEPNTYEARTALSFAERGEDVELLEGNAQPVVTADFRPAVAAELIDRKKSLEIVRRALDFNVSVSRLREVVSAEVATPTNLLYITVRWGDARQASQIANEVARAIRQTETRKRRAQIKAAAGSLRRRFRRLDPQNPITRSAFQDRISQLQALAGFSRPIEIVRPATVPGAPVSPRPVRNGLLGLLLGLTLGILAAFVRDALDRRLKQPQDVQHHLDLPVLGHVGESSLGKVPTANGDGGLSETEVEAFRILRVNLDFTFRSPPGLIAVTSGLPEEGKSTVAISLASVSAAAGRRTALLECDLRRPSISTRLGVARGPGLTDYLAGLAEMAEVRQELRFSNVSVPVGGPNGNQAAGPVEPESVVCVTAGDFRSHAGELLGSTRFREMLDQMRQEFDLVVLDTAPLLSVVDTRNLLPLVDGVLVCVRASRTTRDEADATKDALNRLPERTTGVVVTGLRPSDGAYYGYYTYETESQ